jgi:hypothetical protein
MQVAALQQQAASVKSANESEIVKKLKFDTQVLMTKLSDYKKAEKTARELVNDYE